RYGSVPFKMMRDTGRDQHGIAGLEQARPAPFIIPVEADRAGKDGEQPPCPVFQIVAAEQPARDLACTEGPDPPVGARPRGEGGPACGDWRGHGQKPAAARVMKKVTPRKAKPAGTARICAATLCRSIGPVQVSSRPSVRSSGESCSAPFCAWRSLAVPKNMSMYRLEMTSIITVAASRPVAAKMPRKKIA